MIVVNDNTEAAQSLLASFQSNGWDCLSAENLDHLQQLCTDPLNQPVIFTTEYLRKHSLDNDDLANLCGLFLVVIAMDSQSLGQEAKFFRLGASDILESDLAQRDIPQVLKRLTRLASIRGHQQDYGERLQKINSKLQQSIKLLEHDQKAGL